MMDDFIKKRWMILLSLLLAMSWSGCGNREEQSKQAAPASKIPAQKIALQKGDPEKGKNLYTGSCSACHGMDATGIKGLGKDLANSEFSKNLTDSDLLEYIKQGRAPGDPLNTTGIAMPPKGGNPALQDQQIVDIIAYMRTLEKTN